MRLNKKCRIRSAFDSLTIVALVVLSMFSVSANAALFEETLAVQVPRGVYGPRGMMGDLIMLRDGTLMMSFIKDGAIMGIKSPDQGKTWGESSPWSPDPPVLWIFPLESTRALY